MCIRSRVNFFIENSNFNLKRLLLLYLLPGSKASYFFILAVNFQNVIVLWSVYHPNIKKSLKMNIPS